jgi:hypothetical protein
MTIVTKLLDAQTDIEAAKQGLGGGNGDAAREFALANTALEDAIMRVNRAFAKKNGKFETADVEAGL